MQVRSIAWLAAVFAAACVPPGNETPQDAGSPNHTATHPAPNATGQPPPAADLLRGPFEDTFDRVGAPAAARAEPEGADSGTDSGSMARVEPSADWMPTMPGIWHIEGGKLCGERAHNHGIWLKRTLPVNARIEFDAVGDSHDGDLKAEYWGDGRSFATGLSYTNATSYLTIFGGWHNHFHVLARLNEHGTDRQEITIDPTSDDPREKPVVAGQRYHFKVERSDGKTVRWWIDGNLMLTYADSNPLSGPGHDHFGFNDWEVKVCFDNVRVVPLP